MSGPVSSASAGRELVLAVDGGASSTRAIVGTPEGDVLGTGVGGPTGLFADDAGFRRLENALRAAVHGALDAAEADPKWVTAACLGLTGVFDERDDGRVARELARQLVPHARTQVLSDAAPALLGASCGGPGILTYSGTGSIAYGVDSEGHEVRAGGWGYLVDDRGGGFRIGAEALEAVFRAADGRGPPTTLSHAVLEHFQVADAAGLLRLIYMHDVADRARIASLVPVVRAAADAGDEMARQLFAEAASRLVELTVAVAERLPGSYANSVFPAGGVFRAGPWLCDPFRDELARRLPDAAAHEPAFPPVIGAYLRGIGHAGRRPDGAVIERIRRSSTVWAGLEQG